MLRFAGASVRAAGTAAEAMSEIARSAPRVIALGERLPDSNGIELAKRVWHDRYGAMPAVSIVLDVLVARHGREKRRQLWD